MKYFLYCLPIIFLTACTNQSKVEEPQKTTAKIADKRPETQRPQIPTQINYDSLDSRVKDQIKILDSIYGRTPYYAFVDGKKMFVVLKGRFNPDSAYYLPKFSGRFKYGIAAEDLKLILPCEYDKIYNPNLTALNSMEIKKDGKVGLFNFKTMELLAPAYDYIFPASSSPGDIAFGFKAGIWYKIECGDKFLVSKSVFSPLEILRSLSFNEQEIRENLLLASYNIVPDEPAYGIGTVVTPSYIEHLGIMPEICDDLILREQQNYDFGTTEMSIKTDTVRSVTDNIVSFIVSFYNEGVDGRGWVEDSKKVVVYNTENRIFRSDLLGHKYDGYDNFCHSEGSRFINDSVIEIEVRNRPDTDKIRRYDFENTYSYKLISRSGEISDLSTNRYYAFTKFRLINESYFSGCYSTWLKDQNEDGTNVEVSEHLTIDDLDLMINEIYAEYGYKFKSSKWQEYFAQFSWYEPKYDNVDNKMNATDKKNIEIISAEKAKMKGKENDYVKKHNDTYSAAG
jgi:hypothetical protein